MKIITLLMTLFLSTQILANNQLPTAKYVEVERYVGKWNAIASLPQRFTNSCLAQTAEYEIIGEGKVSVLNTCLKKKGAKTIKGQAVVVNKETNASLIVTFNNFWTRLFKVKGDYQVLKLDADYEYVLVGSNNKKSLWIMSREESMPKEIFEDYKAYAKSLGFDVSKLVISKF